MPKSPPPPVCPVDALLRLLMGSWTTYVLFVLRRHGPTRFGALRREIGGISARVLTERLRLLERHGIIFREQKPTIPPEVTYGLTAQGEDLGEMFAALEGLAARWYPKDQAQTQQPSLLGAQVK